MTNQGPCPWTKTDCILLISFLFVLSSSLLSSSAFGTNSTNITIPNNIPKPVFARQTLTKPINLQSLQSKLCSIWSTKPNTTKLILTRVDDWTDESFQEDIYVDIRAYGKSERTREMVLDGMKQVQSAFGEEGLIANVRLETYDGERYFHVPPTEDAGGK